jgi:hypothetical protein
MPRGSRPGERRGGRQRGTPNKKTAERYAEMAASGEMPLEYMLRVMRDETADRERRDEMAKSAAPYLHPRLASVESKSTERRSVLDYTQDELVAIIADQRTDRE